jgi:hypothetical protein
MGAKLSTSSGCQGSTVKLSCPNGHIMEGSKVKYGRFDNNTCKDPKITASTPATFKEYSIPKKCINKENCQFEISELTIKDDPAPGLPKQFEVALACFEPPHIPGLKDIMKKNLPKKKQKKAVKTLVSKIFGSESKAEEKSITIVPKKESKSTLTLVQIFTNKFVLLAIAIIIILWIMIVNNHKTSVATTNTEKK